MIVASIQYAVQPRRGDIFLENHLHSTQFLHTNTCRAIFLNDGVLPSVERLNGYALA